MAGVLIEAAQRLTYRGYDSVGAATLNQGRIDLRKDVGKVDAVAKKFNFSEMRGQRGIAQLREREKAGFEMRRRPEIVYEPSGSLSGTLIGAPVLTTVTPLASAFEMNVERRS